MFDLKACVVCLKADVKLFSMNNGQLRQQFYLVAGLKVFIYSLCLLFFQKHKIF